MTIAFSSVCFYTSAVIESSPGALLCLSEVMIDLTSSIVGGGESGLAVTFFIEVCRLLLFAVVRSTWPEFGSFHCCSRPGCHSHL